MTTCTTSKLCLRWNGGQQAPFLSAHGSVANEVANNDVILMCGLDHGKVEANRLVLSACSDLLANALKCHTQDPKLVVVLPEAHSEDLGLIKSYMYTGEARVEENNVHNFLDLANLLRVKGVGERPTSTSTMRNKSSKRRPRRQQQRSIQRESQYLQDEGHHYYSDNDLMLSDTNNEMLDSTKKIKLESSSEDKKEGENDHSSHHSSPKESGDDNLKMKGLSSNSERKRAKSPQEVPITDTNRHKDEGDTSMAGDKTIELVNISTDDYDDNSYNNDDDYNDEEALNWLASSKAPDFPIKKSSTKRVTKKEPRYDCLRRPRIVHERSDPLVDYDESSFIKRHRFDKKTFLKLVDILRADLDVRQSRRGCPLSPVQQIAVALHHLGSQHFQRDIGQEAGTAQTSARNHTMQVMRALIANEPRLLRLPDADEMEQSSSYFQDRFGIPNVCMVIGSFLVKIKKRPSERELPKNFFPEEFLIKDTQIRYKQTYAHKCLFAVDHNLRIRFVDSAIPGLRRDSEVWSTCSLRSFLSSHNNYRIVAHRSLPLSSSVLVPYSNAEASIDPRKAELNSRLEALLKDSSERLISLLRRRFPFMKSACRTFYENISRDLHASCILHNFAIDTGCMGSEFFDDDDQTEEQLIVEVDDNYYEYQEEPQLSEDILIGNAYRDALLVSTPQ